MASNSLRIYLRHYQWHLRIHAEGTGVINNNGTSLYSSRSKSLAGSTTGKESNIHTLERSISSLLHSVLLAHELNLLAGRTLGSQQLQLCKRKIALLNQIQEFLAYRTGSTQNSNIVLLHILNILSMLDIINALALPA